MKTAHLFRILTFLLLAGGWHNASAIITIDSVQATQSNCANDGTMRIYARSASSLLYAIVSGPDIRPQQSGSTFSGLPTGNYQVMVTNFSNDTGIVNATVGGVYDFPDFTPYFTNPTCPGSYTGTIRGRANSSTGRAPFTWELTSLATNVTITQANDTFSGLNGGDYRLRVYDSCQNFATRYLTLVNPISTFTVDYIYNTMIACDTDIVSIPIFATQSYLVPPFIVTINLGGVTKTDTFNPVIAPGNTAVYLYDTIAGVTYGAGGYVSVTNGCGENVFVGHYIDSWWPTVTFYALNDSCEPKVKPSFNLAYNFPSRTVFHGPITSQVWDNTTGTKIDSTVYAQGAASYYPDYFLLPGHSYHMTVEDACGNFTPLNFTTPVADTVRVYVSKDYLDACLDSTGTVNIVGVNYSPASTTVTILSGPPVARSTKPYFIHNDSISYPASSFLIFHCGAYSPNAPCFGISGLPIGAYTFRIQDDCGHLFNGSFTIDSNDISLYTYRHEVIRGCPGQNKIKYQITRNKNNMQQDKMRLYPLGSTFAIDSITSDSASFSNLNAGTYVLEHYINLYHSFDLVNPGMPCNILRDTIVVPPYQLPKIGYATQIKCNGTVNVGLQPDSLTGVPPYNYEIVSGPNIAAVQASNFFTLTQPGIYSARISDTCGFARTFTFSVDTLSFQQIVQVGSSCVGNTAVLTAQRSPYATYIWQRPNGTFFTGDSLKISPVAPADYGVYKIRKIVNVNLCQDTFYATYTLNSVSTTHLYDTICAGSSVNFAGGTYNQTGIYYDTIATSLCDSIVSLNLLVTGGYDSTSRTICTGQSVTVGTHTYTTAGIYRDTFTTNGCDSLHILNLSVSSHIIDSVSQTICPGQSITVGAHTYTTNGVYRDTFATVGCDSIHILNLQVSATRADSVTQTICAGQSITIGPHTYSTTGIYRDTFATTGCDSIHILNLQVNALKQDSVRRSICTGQSITIGTHTYTATGIYRDTFTTAGCDSVFILNLQVGGTKLDSVTQFICQGQSITIGTHTYSATGIYRDTFATVGCDSVHILNLQVRTGGHDSVALSICSGQSITVGSHVYTATGIYRDTMATTQCDSIHILNLAVTDILRDTIDVTLCEGESITIEGHTFTQPGMYTDTFETAYCDSVRSIQVSELPRPAIRLDASSTSVAAGDTIQLDLTGQDIASYRWQPVSILSNPDIQNPVATIHEPVWIIAMATDSNNCSAVDSIYITVPDCKGYVFIPNAFTPNGDGNNDEYRIYGPCVRLNYLHIFNRWGEMIWETSDMEQGWNGYYKGVLQPVGVYVYVVNYFDNTDNTNTGTTLRGSLTLIR